MTCSLSYAADMLELITNGLLKHDRVEPVVGNVTNLGRNPGTRRWYVTLEPNEIGHDQSVLKYQTPMVVYCTGSHPITTELPLDIPRLSLETGLAPSRLAKLLPTDKPCTVAVIGDGHSAVLTLRNLFYLAAISHRHLRIRWFTRTANLRYAEETPEGVILNENTGLMGEAARFARAQLEGDKLETSDAGAFITRVILPTSAGNDESATQSPEELESEVLAQNLEGVDYVIQAIGFTRSRLPALVPRLSPYRDPLGKPKRMVFNALTGWFFPNFASRSNVIGLFGAGSAFPELEFTSEGWRSPAVSMWKFMRFLQRMVPKWIEATKKGKFAEPPNRQECIEEAPRVVPPERLECIEEAPRLHGGGSS
ncbi:fda2512a-ebbe-4105-9c05-62a84ea4a32b [Thermothielavioides terrestris]|uniref:Fda2512a-ebbe-4105-9c05-62a84ea4a32b n=1 Tax=Thermothielavioides terrestris TaxID=2587410 RepID=A0A446BA15_9PEZI|nr:fda2512a-ebbe-4105-9c05-62a84ea4a32b [Thermothielavioides terrestris]